MAIFRSTEAEFWVYRPVPLEIHAYVSGLVGGEFTDGCFAVAREETLSVAKRVAIDWERSRD